MPTVRTEASKRYGLPEVPGKVEDVTEPSRRDTYKQLRTLGTMAYDIREIIYHRGNLTQRQLKEELESYGYTVSQDGTAGDGGALVVLEEVTKEITREGSKNDTVITWVGKESNNDVNAGDEEGSTNKPNTGSEVDTVSLKQEQPTTDFPVSEQYEVVGGKTIYKEGEWWKAIVLYDNSYGTNIAMYSWKNDGRSWARKQKYRIWSEDEWQRIKQVTEEAIKRVESVF